MCSIARKCLWVWSAHEKQRDNILEEGGNKS